ncbi:TFIID-31kDa-domain-containing protein [Hypoxylon sp. FL1150]|nr:TFIID-31kDa-domain-containing protein [Hypoxylon sp. FL1150]
MASASQSQTNGVSSSVAGPSQSQPTQNTTTSGSTTVQNTQATGPPGPLPSSPTLPQAPRPRDSRTIELLLTSQGVTSYDQRVPLLLLDFAYRHTSSVLSDALHLSTDPYVTHAGSKPSGSSGAVPSAPSAQDATVSTSAVNLAIASRQSFQFRGGAGGHNGGGGASKEWLQELARERNRTALPRILANEWGVRLPNERFVLSGQAWSLKETWDGDGGDGDDDDEYSDEEEMIDIIEGPSKKDSTGNAAGEGGEGGGFDELLEDDVGDEDMEGME